MNGSLTEAGRFWQLHGTEAWPTSSGISLAAATEWQRIRLHTAPLFQLRDRIDESQVRTDGRLIRSPRLARVEAVLLIARGGLSAVKLAQFAGLVDSDEAEQLIETLNDSYDATNSAFRIERTATGFTLMTRPALVTWLDQLHERQSQLKLSQPMMETLTIVAYQQPITRAAVEAIRGVQSAEMIRQLIDRGLMKVGGEDDSLGRPFLYITTRQFLDMFGIGKIEDLPDFDTIGRAPAKPEPKQQTQATAVSVSDGPQQDRPAA